MKKKIIIFTALVSMAVLYGCNDFLDKIPDNRAEIKTSKEFAELVASGYPKACYAVTLLARSDDASDTGAGTSSNINKDSFFWRPVTASGLTDQDSPQYIWQKYWLSVATVNHALAEIDNIEDPQNLGPYVAEAKMVRAFTHFLLVNLFSKFYEYGGTNQQPGVPYVTEPEDVVIKKYDRGTVASVYEMIEKDLTEGLAGLGSDEVYEAPQYHFTKAAAHTFASRFYLYKGEWAKVLEHCNSLLPQPTQFINEQYGDLTDHTGKVISSGTLISRNVSANDQTCIYAEVNFTPWLDPVLNKASSSDAMRLYAGLSTNKANLLLTEMRSFHGNRIMSHRYCTGVTAIAETIHDNTTSVAGGVWAYRYFSTASSSRYSIPKIYTTYVPASSESSSGYQFTTFPYLRIEEVLINRAEAYALTDRIDEAIDDLNVFCRFRIVGKRSSDPYYNEDEYVISKQKLLNYYGPKVSRSDHYMNKYNAFGSADWDLLKKCVVQCVLDFRRNEYLGEALRYWDLLRYKIPVTHTTSDGLSNQLLPGDDRWVLEIPEVATLSGIELNPLTNLLTPSW